MTTVKEWGLECPMCLKDDKLVITAAVSVSISPDGTELVDGAHEWSPESPCSCEHCGWSGIVLHATIEEEPT